MDNTTDTLTRPAGGFAPPPSAAPAPWPGQISQAPTLPTVTAAVPRPAHQDANPFASAMFQSPAPQPPARSSGGGFRRGISWLLLLAVLGGIAYAGFQYGPAMMEKVTGSDQLDEPSAPLVYPMPTVATPAIRTAAFTVSEPDAFGGTQNYDVTTDLETGVSQVVIPGGETPDLEILSVWDQSFIRRIDDPTWYSLPRGDFPIDTSLGRSRWVRTLDELVPPAARAYTTVEEATESSVGSEPARRLVLSADAIRLLQAQTASVTPTANGTPAPAPPLPPGINVQPAPAGVEAFTMEIWVDDAGIIRKSIMPPELGGETITVTSVTSDAFEPIFPTPDMVQPLTAQALFRLGL